MAEPLDPMTQRAQMRVGQVLRGKWRLDRLLGIGGMASVYAASHRNGKRGAVKMLHVELSFHEDARNRFLREGYVANKVDHPGAVSVLDDDVTEEGAVFLVMELLDGTSVDDLAQGRPARHLEIGEVVAVADDLLDVLASAHEKGIVHRDLKPENLFVTRRGELKVLDFGIARLREIAGSASATRTGSMMGTPAFMPPEQALGNWDQVDARSDLWAVGATMFILLTGRHVHAADTVNKVLLLAMSKPAPPIASVWPGVPPGIAAVVDRALAFDAAHRWPDARSMQHALRQAAQPVGACILPAVPAAPSVLAASIGMPPAPVSAPVHAPSPAGPAPSAQPPSAPWSPSAPQSRTPSGTEVARPVTAASAPPELLAAVAPTFSGTAAPAPAPPRRRGIAVVAVVGVLSVAGVAAAALVWRGGASTSAAASATVEASAPAPASPATAGSGEATATPPAAPTAPDVVPSASPSASAAAEPSATASAEAAASAPAGRPTGQRRTPGPLPRGPKPSTPTPQDRDHGF